jgi:putative inorganic carbon (HCO3(-)) transporter
VKVTKADKTNQLDLRYLVQEALLFLVLSYVFLLGGTFNGLVLYNLNVTNTVILSVIGIAWFTWVLIKKRSFPTSRLDFPLIALFGATLLTSILSVDPRRSYIAFVQLAIYIFIFYLVVDLIRAGWPAELFTKVLLLVSVFNVFFGLREIVVWIQGWSSIGGWEGWLPPSTLRIRAFLGHPNFVASYFLLLVPLGLTHLITSSGRGTRAIILTWTVSVGVLVFFTSSRGGWIGLAAGLGVMVALYYLDRPQKVVDYLKQLWGRRLLLILIIPILVAGLLVLFQLFVHQSQHPTHGTGGVSSRAYIWGVAWNDFIADPISGQGPFTYGTDFMRENSVPPDMLLAHAHNYMLNVAAESGLLGLFALFGITLAILRLIWIRWRSETPGNRSLLIGAAASLAGFAVHSIFDTPETFPALNITAAILIGIIASPDQPSRPWNARFAGGFVIASWTLAVVGLWFSLRAYRQHTLGVEASNREDWTSAAEFIDQAAELDPQMAFYSLQSGYAHGQLALAKDGSVHDGAELDLAIASYEKGTKVEPVYATNWANLGSLLWAQGEEDRAIDSLERAVSLAPREPAFRLTLGRMYESSGELEKARGASDESLTQRTYWLNSYFFRETALRREVQAAQKAADPYSHLLGGPTLEPGWIAIESGEYARAVLVFKEALGVNNSEAYLALGLAHQAAGELDAAEVSLKIADNIPHLSGWTTVRVKMALGSLAKLRQDCDLAAKHFEAALDLVKATTSLGVGRMGVSDYGWYIFYRQSIAADMLPGVNYLIYTDEVVEGMLELAACYEIQGENRKAEELYNHVIEIAPDNTMAKERLSRMR